MASNMMRVKWLILGKFTQQKAEVLAVIFVLGMISILVTFLYQSSRPMEGTFIDLSQKHQEEIIEDFKKDLDMNRQLLKEQKGIDEMEGNWDSEKQSLFLKDHVPYPKEFHDDTEKKMNLTERQKNNRLLGGKPPGFKVKPSPKPKKTKREYVKFYDPSVGRMVMKPVIKEITDLEGGQGHCAVYDLESKAQTNFSCVSLSIRPVTHVCLYPDAEDIHISRHIREEGIWEPHIVKEYQNTLYGDPDLAVIDIGANIGLYSLLAAKMGHDVIAVEPYEENILRLQKAAQMDNTTRKIVVLQNAISDKRNELYLKLQSNNQGGVSLQKQKPNPDCVEDECKAPKVKVIHMDDMLEVITFDKALIKIDIEGMEHRAFVHSKQLLDKVYVPHIFMEWMKLRQYHGSELTQTEDKDLTWNLVHYLVGRGYQPYSSVTMERLKPDWWVGWTDDIIWKHELREFN